MASYDYFYSDYRDSRLLQSHGMNAWPDTEELARYAFELQDALDALCEHFGVELAKDIRKNWVVVPTCKGEGVRHVG